LGEIKPTLTRDAPPCTQYGHAINGWIKLGGCFLLMVEGSLEVNLPTIWTDGQAQVGRVREQKRRRETIKEEKESEERRYRCMKR